MTQPEGSEENEEGLLWESEPLFPSFASVKSFCGLSQAQKIFARRATIFACSSTDITDDEKDSPGPDRSARAGIPRAALSSHGTIRVQGDE